MSAKEIWKLIEANWGWFIAAIVTLQGFVEKFGKLTKKPLTSLISSIGKVLNSELAQSQAELQKSLIGLRQEVEENEQLQWRYQIVDFASRCDSPMVTRDQYSYILLLIDKYNSKYAHNGELKLSAEIIQKEYENFRRKEDEKN